MRRPCFVVLLAAFVVVASAGQSVRGYGSAGHVYIAQHATYTLSVNALYGSMAPDIIGYLPTAPTNYAALFEVNHAYFNLMPKAVTLTEKAFALGWMTHNETWGADYFAHVKQGGYAWVKGQQIVAYAGEPLASMPNAGLLGHLATEIAVDVLLSRRDPLLGLKVYVAADRRSPSIPNFLYQSGVIPIEELAIAGEEGFRQFTKQYGLALAASSPSNLGPIAEFVAAAAAAQYQAPITAPMAEQILALAIQLCQPDYLPVVNAAIRQVQFHVWRGDF